MKTKILFSMLIGGALLASCSMDDGIDTSVAKKGNLNAPTFTVHFGNDDLTRAYLNAGHQMFFEVMDKFSLYNGVNEEVYNKASYELTDYQNAIYDGHTNSAGKFVLSTAAMVQPGGAILVYPADTAFVNTGKAPLITLSNLMVNEDHERVNYVQENDSLTQPKGTRNLLPFMSEVIKIADYNSNKNGMGDEWNNDDQTAGYGRNYDVDMKQVGSTLMLAIAPENLETITFEDDEDVDPLQIKSVEINVKKLTAGEKVFTYAVPVKSSAALPAGHHQGTVIGHVHTRDCHQTWVNVSELDRENVVAASKVLTEDIDNERDAFFTLLPVNSNYDENLGEEAESEPDEDGQNTKLGYKIEGTVQAFDDVTITVYTNYGRVEVKGTEVGKWHKAKTQYNASTNTFDAVRDENGEVVKREDSNERVLEGLAYVLDNLYGANGTGNFKGENVGAKFDRVLDVDVTKLIMNGLHIENESQLYSVSKVFEKLNLASGAKTVFYLDGDANGVFEMTEKGIGAYEAILAKGAKNSNHDVIITPCGVHKVISAKNIKGCEKIQLINKTDPTVADVVPNQLLFGAKYDNNEVSGTRKPLTVELVGKWELSDSRTYQNVDILQVASTATLELKQGTTGNITAENISGKMSYTDAPKLVNEGTMNVAAGNDVILKLETENYGTMNLTGVLNMSATDVENLTGSWLTLTNMIRQKGSTLSSYEIDYVKETAQAGGSQVVRGKIYINGDGQLSSVQESGGHVVNLGYIQLDDADDSYPVLLLDENQTSSTNFAKAINVENNVYGVVNYQTKEPNLSSRVKNASLQGFTVRKLNNVSGVKYSDWSDKINYLIVDAADCASIVGYAGKEDGDSSNSLYLDIQNVKSGATIAGRFRGLVVSNSNTRLNIETNTTLSVSAAAYIKGRITNAGSFVNSSKNQLPPFTGYMGGSEKDAERVSAAN